MIRERIETIIRAHKDKDAETLSGMIAGLLYAVNLAEPEGGWFDDDPRYADENGDADGDKIWDDWKSVGIERLGRL